MLACVIALIGLNSLVFVVLTYENGTCQPRLEHIIFWEIVWPWIDLGFASVFPFLFICGFNVGIVINLQRSSDKRSKMGGTKGKDSATASMTRMSVIIGITYIVLTWSSSLFNVFVPGWIYEPDQEYKAKLYLIKATCQFLMFSNNGINFYLYVITGTRFRTEFIAMLKTAITK